MRLSIWYSILYTLVTPSFVEDMNGSVTKRVFKHAYENLPQKMLTNNVTKDMSAYVKKIQFKLHESYGNPLRVVTKPPYEITETGWGEFEIIIKIFFIDPNERPVTLYHLLKLFQSDTNAMLGKKTVVSEFYDEMIFQDPTAMMQQLLTTSRQLTLGAYKHETEFAELEVKTREKLEAAKKKTSFEIAELKERLKASRETINCLKNEIRKLEEDDQTKEI
ncbi:YEATS domain-containing protein 4 isoform 5-T5 [Trichechus inunguis]